MYKSILASSLFVGGILVAGCAHKDNRFDPNNNEHTRNQCSNDGETIDYKPGMKQSVLGCPSYSVIIDPSYDCVDGIQNSIIERWLEWQELVGDNIKAYLAFPETITDNMEHCAIKIINSTPPPQTAGWTWNKQIYQSQKPDAVIIWVKSNIDPIVYQQVFGHEIGHSFGLAHNVDEHYSVMYPEVDTTLKKFITCLDKRALCNIWGCNPGC